ncbi:hypothetical protein [Lentzea sp. E54]|uniref:hypothetical protein n=1 Tax=Lentzea xerophila TaxID=3435883 RepID=UPI003DA259F4
MNAVLLGLASNPALPGRLLDRLVVFPELGFELASRADLSTGHVHALLSHGDPSVVHQLLSTHRVRPADVPLTTEPVALALTGHPGADPAVARVLAFHPDPAIRRQLPERAHHLPADVIERLAGDDDPEVVAELVTFHALPPALALAVSRHPAAGVRHAVAASPHTPAPVLVALSADDSLARELASNPATPPLVAADLLRHHASRYFLASRTDLPVEVYERLASEIEPGILSELAANPAVPAAVLRHLTGTRALLRNPAIPLDLLVELAPAARIGTEVVPRVAAASAAELRTLAGSPVTQVRMMVAARADLPLDLVQSLVLDDDPGVAAAVVTNPLVSVTQLWELVSRHGARLYPRVARNPSCPPELLHHMALAVSSAEQTYRAIARHPAARGETLSLCLEDAQARHLAAAHPHLPVETIVEFLGSEFTAGPAAANPSLPVAVMEDLLNSTT